MQGAAQYPASGLECVNVPPTIGIFQQDWCEFYKNDPQYQDIWPQLVKDRAVGKCFFHNGKVRSKGKICVPVTIVTQLLNGLHSYAHPGSDNFVSSWLETFQCE